MELLDEDIVRLVTVHSRFGLVYVFIVCLFSLYALNKCNFNLLYFLFYVLFLEFVIHLFCFLKHFLFARFQTKFKNSVFKLLIAVRTSPALFCCKSPDRIFLAFLSSILVSFFFNFRAFLTKKFFKFFQF